MVIHIDNRTPLVAAPKSLGFPYDWMDVYTREKCPYSELFWSVFSRIRTDSEYGHFLRIVNFQ